ncbi:hypothetical protein V866_002973 [Kwoniella sp. B9012]
MSNQHGSSAVTPHRPNIPSKISSGSGSFEISLPSSSSSTQDVDSSSSSSTKARFSTLSAAYPLKLLTPSALPSQPSSLGIVYTLAYGGGLVSGDLISLRGEVGKGCGLVMLTQGSTKVYKKRPGIRPKSSSTKIQGEMTRQRLHVTLQSEGLLLLLPDSISPFSKSKYTQHQRFVLPSDRTGSALILDWVNSGRGLQDQQKETEIWSMDYYDSTNEVYMGDELLMRERMVLDNQHSITTMGNSESRMAKSLAPYHVYSTILYIGPKFEKLAEYLKFKSNNTRQYQLKSPQELIWSYSETDQKYMSGVIRIASVEIEQTRIWLREILESAGIKDLVGEGIWPRCL